MVMQTQPKCRKLGAPFAGPGVYPRKKSCIAAQRVEVAQACPPRPKTFVPTAWRAAKIARMPANPTGCQRAAVLVPVIADWLHPEVE